jgi:hypothetical protein
MAGASNGVRQEAMENAMEQSCLLEGCYMVVISRLLSRSVLPSFHSPLSHLRNVTHNTAGEVRDATSQKTATCMVNSKETSDPACNKFRPVLKRDQSPLRKSGNGALCTVICVTEISIIFRHLQPK